VTRHETVQEALAGLRQSTDLKLTRQPERLSGMDNPNDGIFQHLGKDAKWLNPLSKSSKLCWLLSLNNGEAIISQPDGSQYLA